MLDINIVLPKNLEVTDSIKEFVQGEIPEIEDAMEGYETLNSLSIVVKVRKNGQQKLELTARSEKNCYRRELVGEDFYYLYPRAVKDIEKAIFKHRHAVVAKKKKHRKKRGLDYVEDDFEEIAPIKRKNIELTFMADDVAIENLEKIGHNFFLYGDEATGKLKVVYLREDEGYGIIACD